MAERTFAGCVVSANLGSMEPADAIEKLKGYAGAIRALGGLHRLISREIQANAIRFF